MNDAAVAESASPPAPGAAAAWPPLPLEGWRATHETLHMWTQVVGKVSLALTPLVNHYWNVSFRLTSRGLATRSLNAGGRALVLTFDFVGHALLIECSDGGTVAIPLEPRTVAEFHRLVMAALRRLGADVRTWPVPVEVPDPIRFDEDTVHRSYDPDAAAAFWRALVAMKPVFEHFRCGFLGKCSPLHFFWGSFDLALTRFSGRRAPARPGADSVTREAYSHEVISHGFWPGSGAVQEAAFYAYAAPEPDGFRATAMRPAGAYYEDSMRLWVLPYDAVRTAPSPDDALRAFFESTYDAGATLGGWNRADLERQSGS